MSSLGGKPGQRWDVNRRYGLLCQAEGRSQSDDDVHDHSDDVHRGLDAVSTQPARVCVRQRATRPASPRRRRDTDLRQLLRRSNRLRAHVATVPSLAYTGQRLSVIICPR